MKVTVVVPTRNRPERIGSCISSILENTYKDFELLIVDQSSNDQTKNILDKYINVDTRTKYFRVFTKGCSAARNFGMEKTSGNIIAFTDDDCIASKDWLEKIVSIFTHNPEVDIILGSALPPPDFEKRKINGPYYLPLYPAKDKLFKGATSKVHVRGTSMNMAMKKEVFNRIGGFDEMLGTGAPFLSNADFDYYYRALRNGFKILESSSIIVTHYGLREGEEKVKKIIYSREFAGLVVYFKHIRCGDWIAGYVLIHEAFFRIVELLKVSIFGVAPRLFRLPRLLFFFYVSYKFCTIWSSGIIKSLRFRIDKKRCIFCAPKKD